MQRKPQIWACEEVGLTAGERAGGKSWEVTTGPPGWPAVSIMAKMETFSPSPRRGN